MYWGCEKHSHYCWNNHRVDAHCENLRHAGYMRCGQDMNWAVNTQKRYVRNANTKIRQLEAKITQL